MLKVTARLPSPHSEHADIVTAFLRLVGWFQKLDLCGVFEALQERDDDDLSLPVECPSLNHALARQLLGSLDETKSDLSAPTEVQKADLIVTRHWMRLLLWRSSGWQPPLRTAVQQADFVIGIARQMLQSLSCLPRDAIDAHGYGVELKIYHLACAVQDFDGAALADVHRLLASIRGGNQRLLQQLQLKIEARSSILHAPSLPQMAQPDYANASLDAKQPRLEPCSHEIAHDVGLSDAAFEEFWSADAQENNGLDFLTTFDDDFDFLSTDI